jgi:hypothetical protein
LSITLVHCWNEHHVVESLLVKQNTMWYGMMIPESYVDEIKREEKKAMDAKYANLLKREKELVIAKADLEDAISSGDNILDILSSDDPIRGFTELRNRITTENTDENGQLSDEGKEFIENIDMILERVGNSLRKEL